MGESTKTGKFMRGKLAGIDMHGHLLLQDIGTFHSLMRIRIEYCIGCK